MFAPRHNWTLKNCRLDFLSVLWESHFPSFPRSVPRTVQAEEEVVVRIDHTRQTAERTISKPATRVNPCQRNRMTFVHRSVPCFSELTFSALIRTKLFYPFPRSTFAVSYCK